MGYRYTATVYDASISGAKSLLGMRPPASGCKEVAIWRAWIGFHENTTSAQLPIQIVRQAATLPTFVTTNLNLAALDANAPANPFSAGTSAAAGTIGILASAEGGGTRTILVPDAFNVLNGWVWAAMPGGEIVIPVNSADILSLYAPVATATADGWEFGIEYEVR